MVIISQTKKEEYGGFQSLEIIRVKDILNCPVVLTNQNTSDFTYNTNQTNDAIITPVGETINLIGTPKKTAGGILYTIKGGFEVMYLDVAVDNLLQDYQEENIIIKAYTNNKSFLIYGSLEFPLTFNYSIQHAKKIETTSKYICSIIGETPQKPVLAKV
ncbi:hypothetical protein BST83_13260 [Polaribacter filamentus]|uniref:Uncharacterized protein n=1 Tax=Polaribacter filamentus TaxID=53483 RepID=A0A2S7KZB7_9FLAO|nr:hypothetical protein [Polaribacter filamentus]PQB08012.1 hypothetical protein BST83_13260 [Polaribacter filamentus]